jgi:hypothetical protein
LRGKDKDGEGENHVTIRHAKKLTGKKGSWPTEITRIETALQGGLTPKEPLQTVQYLFTTRMIKLGSNYGGMSLPSTSYKTLSKILLSRLSPFKDEIIGDHQCGFRHNRLTANQIFCIRRILEKNCEYNETVHQLFTDFKRACDSVRREVLYNILIEFGIPTKLASLIKM